MDRLKRSARGDRGASLVEFAMLMPLLVILLLGIVEFGWIFSQNNDVRHGAREGARAAAVNLGNNALLHTETCDSMDLTSPVTVQFFEDPAPGNGVGEVGEIGVVEVIATPDSLSGLGLVEVFLPSTLTSRVEFRLEQPADAWSTDGAAFSCP